MCNIAISDVILITCYLCFKRERDFDTQDSHVYLLLYLPPAYIVRREGNSFTLFVSSHLGGVSPAGGGWVRSVSQGGQVSQPMGGGQVSQPTGGGEGQSSWWGGVSPAGGGGQSAGGVSPAGGGVSILHPLAGGMPLIIIIILVKRI